VSLPCEWSWAIGLFAAPVVAQYMEPTTTIMQMLFLRKNFEDGNSPSPGLFEAQDLEYSELSLISSVKPIQKYLAFEPRSGTTL
jgi:hypothetical protein